MNENKKLTIFDKALIGIVPFTFILAILLFFITGNNNGEVKSVVVGALATLLLSYWNYRMTTKISEENYQKLKVFSIVSFIVRYTIMVGLLVIALFTSYNPIYMLFGFIEYPLLILVFSLSGGKGDENGA